MPSINSVGCSRDRRYRGRRLLFGSSCSLAHGLPKEKARAGYSARAFCFLWREQVAITPVEPRVTQQPWRRHS